MASMHKPNRQIQHTSKAFICLLVSFCASCCSCKNAAAHVSPALVGIMLTFPCWAAFFVWLWHVQRKHRHDVYQEPDNAFYGCNQQVHPQLKVESIL